MIVFKAGGRNACARRVGVGGMGEEGAEKYEKKVETSVRSVTKHLDAAKAGLENMIARRQTAHAAVERLKTSMDQAREARIAAEEYDLQRKTEHRTTGDMVGWAE